MTAAIGLLSGIKVIIDSQMACSSLSPLNATGRSQQKFDGEDAHSSTLSSPVRFLRDHTSPISAYSLTGCAKGDPGDSYLTKDQSFTSELLFQCRPYDVASLLSLFVMKLTSYFDLLVGNVMARRYLPINNGRVTDDNPLRTMWIPVIMKDPLLFQATTNGTT